MIVLLFMVLFCILFAFSGYGLCWLLCPADTRKYLMWLSPFVGFGYLTFVGWHLYSLGLPGTDSYAWFLMLLPGVFATLRLALNREFKITGDQVAIWLGMALAAVVVSYPLWAGEKAMTSISLLNCDLPDSASVSRFLKEFARNSQTGFLGQSNAFVSQADGSIFGGPFTTAFVGSLFRLETYQLQSMSVMAFFILGMPLIYSLAREAFKYSAAAAWLMMMLYGLNSVMLFIIYQGYQGQIIAMGLAVGLVLLNYIAADRAKSAKQFAAFLPLSVILVWGVSITYGHMLPLIFAVIASVVLPKYLREKTWRPAWLWLGFTGATFIGVFLLSPYRGVMAWRLLLQRGGDVIEWFFPLMMPQALLGLTFKNAALNSVSLLKHLPLTLVVLIAIAYGMKKTYESRRDVFWQTLSLILILGAGYVSLAISGRHDAMLGGYKSFKFITFFLPLIFVFSLLSVRQLTVSELNGKQRKLAVILAVFAVGSIYSTAYSVANMTKHHLAVTAEMAQVQKTGIDPRIGSVNVLGKDWWEILWAADFLMEKKLYFETTTYCGRNASELKGDWDLVKTIKGNEVQSSGADSQVVPINELYQFRRSNSN